MLSIHKIRTIFNELNAKHFNNELPLIQLAVSNRLCSMLGKFQWSYRTLGNTTKLFITIYNRREHYMGANSEVNLIHTIMHEMVHYHLFLKYTKRGIPIRMIKKYCGHNSEFKMTMHSFGFNGSATHPHFLKEVPPASIIPPVLVPVYTAPRYKVLSTGKIGTFVRESMVYGKKHVSLQIEGLMFPFTTAMDNVVPA